MDDDIFEKFEDEFVKFENVENKLSNRPDLHAFLLLESLVPGTTDMVSAAEHDQIYLDVDVEELAEKATEDQLRDLSRCGVMHSGEYDCLMMFV